MFHVKRQRKLNLYRAPAIIKIVLIMWIIFCVCFYAYKAKAFLFIDNNLGKMFSSLLWVLNSKKKNRPYTDHQQYSTQNDIYKFKYCYETSMPGKNIKRNIRKGQEGDLSASSFFQCYNILDFLLMLVPEITYYDLTSFFSDKNFQSLNEPSISNTISLVRKMF